MPKSSSEPCDIGVLAVYLPLKLCIVIVDFHLLV